MQFLETLKERSMHEVRLVGDIAGRRVEGKIKDGRAHFEG
jgi:hypothetical protein